MSKGKTKRILLGILLAGSITNVAHAELTYTTYKVTEETNYVTYIDADGNEQKYEYTTKVATPETVTVSGLKYNSPNGGTNEIYYAWTEDGFVQVTDASSADVTVKYADPVYGAGIYNDGTTEYEGQNIIGDFINDDNEYADGGDTTRGGAIENYAGSGNASLGTITGNFIGDYEAGSTGEYGGAIANYVPSAGTGNTASIEAIEGNFIGNYLQPTGNYISSVIPIMGGGAIYSSAMASNSTVQIGSITGDFIGNHIVLDETITTTEAGGGGAIFNRGEYNNSHAYINSITGNFIGNYIDSIAEGFGGAIYNDTYYDSAQARIDNIEGNFIGNYVVTKAAASGGAIFNRARGVNNITEIGTITGDFIGNYATSSGTYALGGAIYNYSYSSSSSVAIGDITGSFIGNYAETSGTDARGGAIFNETEGSSGTAKIGSITGDFIGNYATSSGTDYAAGGAIFNKDAGSGSSLAQIGTIEGDFIGNYAESSGTYAYGGAIFNYSSASGSSVEIGDITGDFVGNYVETSGTYVRGGAIFNQTDGSSGTAKIGNIKGDFIDNYATSSGTDYAAGGAIFNKDAGSGSSLAQIGTIEGDFIGNYAESSKTYASGGAIFNQTTISGGTASIGAITGDFIGNHATSSGTNYAYGGAIYNEATVSDGTASIGAITGDFIGNYAVASSGDAAGGAIYNSAATIGTITGDFINNYALSENGTAYGGAIYNEGTIGEGGGLTLGNLTGNYAQGTTDAKGGAVYDTVNTSVTVNGDASGNYVKVTEAGDVAGGVIYLKQSENGQTSVTVTGDVTGNHAETASGEAKGGAFYNNAQGTLTIGGDISGNYALSENGTAYGGAIYNEGTVTGGDGLVLGNLTGNYAQGTTDAKGGAVYDTVNTSVTVNGDASGNYVKVTEAGNVAGGIIYLAQAENNATTVTVTGNVTGNHAETASGEAKGGAFYNNAQGTLTIGGDISGNYALSENGAAYGGAIYNEGTVTGGDGLVLGNLTGNYAQGTTDAKGGAVYDTVNTSVTINGDASGNYVKVTKAGDVAGGVLYLAQAEDSATTINVTGNVTGNHAETASGMAMGGAFYNNENATLTIGGDISGNYATATEGSALGGAIYSLGTITIEGNVTNNYTEGSDVQGGAIYAGENATVNLSGSITGNYASGDTAQGGAIYNAGTVNINIKNQDAVISGNYTESGGTQEANVLYGELGSVTNFNLTDATLRLEDSLNGDTGFEVNVTGNGTDATTFYMLNDITDSNLSFDSTTVNTINSEIHAYSVNKLSINGDVNFVADVDLANETMDRFTASEYGEHAGKLNVSGMNLISDTEADSIDIYFAEDGLKDYVTSSVGTLPDSKNQQKAYTPLYEYNVAYDNRDDAGYFTFDKTGNNPSADVPEEAEAAAISFMNLMYRYAFEHSDYYMKLPRNVRQAIIRGENCGEDENCLENYRAYNGHNLTDPGIWVKPFASNETVPFGHQFTARTKNYGLLVGVDTAFKEKGRWANVFTGYVGYDGIRQTFSGNSTEQYGGLLGVTDTVYNGNFFAAVTLSGGDNVLKAKTMYGREKTHLYMGGAAVKTGYNMEFAGGNYSFLPTFMASYTYANIKDYTSASGLKMDSNGMHAVELNPNFKFIRNLNSGWMPYATVGEIWTVGQHSDVRASGTLLDELTFRPYTEYGLGVQKMWSKGYDGYAEFLGHAGGRRGFLINLGFRWAFN